MSRGCNQTYPHSPGTSYVELTSADPNGKDLGNIRRLSARSNTTILGFLLYELPRSGRENNDAAECIGI